jgi:hypothetical protein
MLNAKLDAGVTPSSGLKFPDLRVKNSKLSSGKFYAKEFFFGKIGFPYLNDIKKFIFHKKYKL